MKTEVNRQINTLLDRLIELVQQYQQAVLNDSPFILKHDLRSRMKDLQEAIEKIKAVKK